MTEADRIFSLFPPFIQEYIYAHGWENLRAVQLAAAKTILETDHHLLLTSSTCIGQDRSRLFPHPHPALRRAARQRRRALHRPAEKPHQ